MAAAAAGTIIPTMDAHVKGPVRQLSSASLKLERIYEQNRTHLQKRADESRLDAAKVPPPAAGSAARGKPRLLLMGQRR